jgi:carbon-monoxide dehydrogenase large subunit
VGGAFGARSVIYPEYVVLLWAARRLARAIKWLGARSEEFLSTTQGRDSVLRGALGLDTDGRFVAFQASGISNLGARHTGNGPFSVMRNLARMLAGVYRTPAISLDLRGVFTNTVPMSSYRAVGRMEAIYLLERLIDRAARETGIDRVELRRRNLIGRAEMPFETPTGAVYDSGDYAANMDLALEAAKWNGFAVRRAEAEKRGRLRGIGIGNYIEGAGGSGGEYAMIAIDDDGAIRLAAGCVAQGQGHETTLRQIAAETLGVLDEDINVTISDTDIISSGIGTNASRSMVRAGTALAEAAEALIDKGRAPAARLLQAEPAAVTFGEGHYRVEGTDRCVALTEVARALARDGHHGPRDAPLMAEIHHRGDAVTYPAGCHVCEVEIDPETGAVKVVQFTAVDDVGRAVNPVIVRGQSQGAIAQGIGEALMEEVIFDDDTGQPLTGSLLDYALPKAADIPSLNPISNDIPSPTNALGVKGAGEGGTTGAPAAVMNAVMDALAPLGVTALDMPASPNRVWAAIRRAKTPQG